MKKEAEKKRLSFAASAMKEYTDTNQYVNY